MNEEYYYGAFCEYAGKEVRKYLKSATGKNVKIGVVDSGWDCSLADSRIKKGICLVDPDDELSLKISDNFQDQNGHGTSCTDIILRLAPDSYIYPVKVFGRRIETSVNILIEAIKWAIENEIKILNFSLGTKLTEALESLYRACEYARQKGIIVVSANTNAIDDYSYPAIFENSIGVEIGNTENIFEFDFIEDEAIECKAKGRFSDVLSLNNLRIASGGNSFAAPVITGLTSLFIERNPGSNLDDVRNFLNNFSSSFKKRNEADLATLR
ncbi:MAG: S8 family serine peptidase [Ignavibacteria bacterium]|jgi:subtilisin family serine protease